MIVKLLTEHRLEYLSLKGGCRSSSESTLVKMSNCWKSHATTYIFRKDVMLFLTLCRLENPKIGTLANSEDPDKMPQNVAFIRVSTFC